MNLVLQYYNNQMTDKSLVIINIGIIIVIIKVEWFERFKQIEFKF